MIFFLRTGSCLCGPAEYLALSLTCTACSSAFPNCYSCNIVHCHSCLPHHFNSPNCQACHPHCDQCVSASSTGCTACYVSQNRNLVGSRCLCLPGFFDLGVPICPPCDPNCQTCISTSTQCTSCLGSWLNAVTFSCQPACPPGQFPNSNNMCSLCFESGCHTCPAGVCTLCQSQLWLDLDSLSCNGFCPDFQFQSSTSGVCARCPSVCPSCTSFNSCTSCTGGYLLSNKGACYRCNCASCGTCPLNCSAGTFYFQNYCYSSCPSGTYQSSPNECSSCRAPCLQCTGPQTCLSCSQGLLLNQKCVKDCPMFLYPSSGKCQQCVQGDVFNSGQKACDANQPRLYLGPSCQSQFSSHYYITLKSIYRLGNSPPLISISYSLNGQDYSSCFQSSYILLPSLLQINVTSGCDFSSVKLLLKVSNVTTVQGIPIRPFQRQFLWQLKTMGYPSFGTEIVQKVFSALPSIQKATFFPLFVFLVPQLMMVESFILLTAESPVQNYALTAAVASLQLHPGCYLQVNAAPNWFQQRLLNSKENQFETAVGRISVSRLFMFNFMTGFVWILASWAVLGLTYLFGFREVGLTVSCRVHMAFHLVLAVSFVQMFRKVQLNTAVERASLAVGLLTLAYYAGFWAFHVNRIYKLSGCQDEERFMLKQQNRALLKKINWLQQHNDYSGARFLLAPLNYRLTYALSQLLLFIAIQAFRLSPWTQLALLLTYSAVCLARLAASPPFMQPWMNYFQAGRLLTVLAYECSLFASYSHFRMQVSSLGQGGLSQQGFARWMALGWVQTGLLGVVVAVVLAQEACTWMVKDDIPERLILTDKIDQLVKGNAREQLIRQNNQLESLRKGEYEVERIKAVREGHTFLLRIVSATELRRNEAKAWIQGDTGVFVRVVNSFMRVGANSPCFGDLLQIARELKSQKFEIRTIGVFDFREAGESNVDPAYYYNVVQTEQARAVKKGTRSLSWTPLQARSL